MEGRKINTPKIHTTTIVSVSPVNGLDGSEWHCWELAFGIPFLPGQFVMISGGGHPVAWARPYILSQTGAGGCAVMVSPGDPLYGLQSGDAVTAWGPNGTGYRPESGERFALLADTTGWMRLRPFAQRYPAACAGLLLFDPAGNTRAAPPEPVPAAWLADASGIAEHPFLRDCRHVFVAMDPPSLAPVISNLPTALREKALVFVGTKVACGVGACRGCHVHSDTVPGGIAVCQKGPFLPLAQIDFQRDQNCLLDSEKKGAAKA